MLGGSVGSLAGLILPGYTGGAGAYALVGMGTTFAGIVRVPFTSVIMIFELTRDYSIIVPLMVSNMISYVISYHYQKTPIYQALAEQDGIHLPDAHVQHRSGRLQVRRAMRPSLEVLDAAMTPAAALQQVEGSRWDAWPVTDVHGLAGMLAASHLRQAAAVSPNGTLMQDARIQEYPHVHADHPLDMALERMGEARLSVLPVVSRVDIRRLEGIVTLDDIMRVYGVARSPDGPT